MNKKNNHTQWVIIRLLILVIFLLMAGLLIGEVSISISDMFLAVTRTLTGSESSSSDWIIIHLRIPRLILAIFVGACLAMSGALLQGLTHNDLADPSIVGINQGAVMMAIIALVVFDDVTPIRLAFFAFLGGSFSAVCIYWLAWRHGSSPSRLVLVGIGVAAIMAALTSLVIAIGNIESVEQAYFWLSGSLYAVEWKHVSIMCAFVIMLLPFLIYIIKPINALILEESHAKSIGQSIEGGRLIVLVVSVLMASISVSLVGGVGFIGLIAPHLARQLVGCDYARLLPVSALLGAALLLAADIAGRVIHSPDEFPAGIIVAIIGAPYFILILIKKNRTT